MPAVRQSDDDGDEVVAILCSDLHLRMKPPPARAREPDWFAAMARPLRELKDLAAEHNAPVVCAGDVFDKPSPPPELINFAIDHLPVMYAVPGQHDLPYHKYDDITKSAFWTLVRAGIIRTLPPGMCVRAGRELYLHGFPWGFPVTPLGLDETPDGLNLAVVHAYIWTKGKTYPGAPPEQRLGKYREALAGYGAAVFGDNHKSFLSTTHPHVLNCGGFMRFKSDEADHRPAAGLLHRDGRITQHYYDLSGEVFDAAAPDEATDEISPELTADLRAFMQELVGLNEKGINYAAAVTDFVAKHYTASSRVGQILLQGLDR